MKTEIEPDPRGSGLLPRLFVVFVYLDWVGWCYLSYAFQDFMLYALVLPSLAYVAIPGAAELFKWLQQGWANDRARKRSRENI